MDNTVKVNIYIKYVNNVVDGSQYHVRYCVTDAWHTEYVQAWMKLGGCEEECGCRMFSRVEYCTSDELWYECATDSETIDGLEIICNKQQFTQEFERASKQYFDATACFLKPAKSANK